MGEEEEDGLEWKPFVVRLGAWWEEPCEEEEEDVDDDDDAMRFEDGEGVEKVGWPVTKFSLSSWTLNSGTNWWQ